VSFFFELRRRNVFRVAGTYAVVAWLLIQVASVISVPLTLPPWFQTFIIVLLAIGFPVALVLAWAFDLTPEGLRLTPPQEDQRTSGGHRLDYMLIGALALVAVVTVWDQLPARTVDAPAEAPQVINNPSIAVLPFEDMSPAGDQEYFGDGIAEELLNVLTRLDGLRVAGRTSSFAYKDRDDDLRAIGQALNVTAILEGSVRKDGERIRITAQLINTADGYHLWSEIFDSNLTDIFSVQEKIAREVAGALGVRLGVGNVNAFIGAGTKNVEAYEAYLKGWSLWDTRGESIRNLETATQLDPNYAAAWAALGVRIAHLQWAANPEDAPALLDRAYERVRRAVELDPMSGQSQSLLGTILYARFDWIGGEEAHSKAIRLRADRSAHDHYGNLLARSGRLAAADRQYNLAIAAEPLAGSSTAGGWKVSLAQGKPEEARQRLTNLYRGNAPAVELLAIALHEGDPEQVKAVLGTLSPTAVTTRILYAPVLRDFDSPNAVLDTLRAVEADDSTRWPSKYHDIALVAAYFGEAEFALQTFEKDARYMVIRLQALWYPVMSEARRLPAFKDLVRDNNLVDFWRSSGWPEACQPLAGEEFSCE
jgi:TolB-like protein